jgi:hypothetical protein
MSLLDNTQTAIGGLRAMTVAIESGEQLVPVTPDVAEEFRRNPRTIKRWIADPKIGFPTPVRINGRLYVARSALESFKQSLLSAALPGKAA